MESKDKKKDTIENALKDVGQNDHQDLAKEKLGNEPEEKNKGDNDSPYKLKKTLDDKRPEDSSIEKGWTVDSNTSRGPESEKDNFDKS